jgi:Spy/CpxP family protein refolding chaperone
MTNEQIRQAVRDGSKIIALRELRARDSLSLREAQAALAALLTPEDEAAFQACVKAAALNPWVQSAPGIYEPASQLKPPGNT